jgi:predicted short-subunit dehydrogenase-like oxidoreductase (DUF2520 family)
MGRMKVRAGRTISILGAGRVGRALGRALLERGWQIGEVVATSATSAREAVRTIGSGNASAIITRRAADADIILITTPDSQIQPTARALARVVRTGTEGAGRGAGKRQKTTSLLQGKVVLHASGALDARALEPLAELGAATGSMHPFQTFGEDSQPDFRGLMFSIEGSRRARSAAREIVRALSGVAVTIPAGVKPAYHCAGAFAATHVLTAVETGAQMLTRLGFPRGLAQRGLLKMAFETLRSWEERGPRATWSGPVSRGDYSTVARHFAALRQFPPEVAAAHAALLCQSARTLAAQPAAVLKRLRAAVPAKPRKRRVRR